MDRNDILDIDNNYHYFLPSEFFLQVFHWRLSYGTFPQVSRTILSILAESTMVTILPLIYNSSSLLSKPLETVSNAPNIVGVTVTVIFQIS